MAMNKNGLFFSLDALFALAVAFLFFSVLFYWISQLDIHTLGNAEMVEYSHSVASVMEQQGAFAQENISAFLGNYTKNQTCFNVTVYSSSSSRLYSVLKSGCTNTSYPSFVTRSFVSSNGSVYFSNIRGWYA